MRRKCQYNHGISPCPTSAYILICIDYYFSPNMSCLYQMAVIMNHWNVTDKLSLWFPPLPTIQFSSVAQSCPTLCDPMNRSHARPPCPSPSPGVHSDSHPSSPWCHPAISSSVAPFSSCPQSLPASESLPMSQLFSWGGQSTGVSALASFLPKTG